MGVTQYRLGTFNPLDYVTFTSTSVAIKYGVMTHAIFVSNTISLYVGSVKEITRIQSGSYAFQTRVGYVMHSDLFYSCLLGFS